MSVFADDTRKNNLLIMPPDSTLIIIN